MGLTSITSSKLDRVSQTVASSNDKNTMAKAKIQTTWHGNSTNGMTKYTNTKKREKKERLVHIQS